LAYWYILLVDIAPDQLYSKKVDKKITSHVLGTSFVQMPLTKVWVFMKRPISLPF